MDNLLKTFNPNTLFLHFLVKPYDILLESFNTKWLTIVKTNLEDSFSKSSMLYGLEIDKAIFYFETLLNLLNSTTVSC